MEFSDISYLIINLITSMSTIAFFAYFLVVRSSIFRQLLNRRAKLKTKVFLSVFFTLLTILGTYMGAHTLDAYAHIRIIGPVVGGFLAGPTVGLVAGLSGGVHRYFLGGFTAFPCALATVIAGLIGGVIYYYRPFNKMKPLTGFWIGVGIILLEMGLVLLLSSPYQQAYDLVILITIPMALSNGLGIAFFIAILNDGLKKEKELMAVQSHKSLKIANQSLNYINQGLNKTSAKEIAKIILNVTDVKAAAVTDQTKVLAHCGVGEDHHLAGEAILTTATEKALLEGELTLLNSKAEIGCPNDECALTSAVIAPLKRGDVVIGSLKLYKTEKEGVSELDIELAQGISQLLSTQLQLSSLKKQAQLATEAELKALQAQIQPHFLFNTLNTIISFCRVEPTKARDLLLRLANFFRRTLKNDNEFISLAEELAGVKDYIAIEKGRFGDKLSFITEIEADLLEYQLPSFTIQPLVENAVKHGLSNTVELGEVKLKIFSKEENLIIKVIDDGIGIAEAKLEQILTEGYGDNFGIGLSNVKERIEKIYGTPYGLEIDSQVGQGTVVKIKLPLAQEGFKNAKETNNSNSR